MSRPINSDIARIQKLLDSGYYNYQQIANITDYSVAIVGAVATGHLRQSTKCSGYGRCPICGMLVILPCVACNAAKQQVTLVLALNQAAYVAWCRVNSLSYRQYRYVGGYHHLMPHDPSLVRVWALPGWFNNCYYDEVFLEALQKYADFSNAPAVVAPPALGC